MAHAGRSIAGRRRRGGRVVALWLVLAVAAAASGCSGRGGGGWRERDLAAETVDWRGVKGQRLSDVLATPSIGLRQVDLLLCRWPTDAPIRIAWPDDATSAEARAFERARAAWSAVLPGLQLETVPRDRAQIVFDLVSADAPDAPSGTADTIADCRVDAGSEAIAPAGQRGRLAQASIVMRREHVRWDGSTSPMTDEEFLGTVLHEIGHALGLAGHESDPIIGRKSVMSADRDRVKRVARRVARGKPLDEPTLVALYTVPFGATAGAVRFDPALRPALAGLATLAEIEGWAGPFGRAGGDSAEVFWRTREGRRPAVFTFAWPGGIRGQRSLDWRLSLEARAALERLEAMP